MKSFLIYLLYWIACFSTGIVVILGGLYGSRIARKGLVAHYQLGKDRIALTISACAVTALISWVLIFRTKRNNDQ